MEVRTIWNFKSRASDIETVDSTDERVVPNCSLSIKEILRRSQAGTIDPHSLIDNRYYDDSDNDIDTPVGLYEDITDLSDVIHKGKQAIDDIRNG